MSTFRLNLKIIGQITFVIIFFSTLEAKNLDKFSDADHVSDYFSGILLLNDNQYNESFKFLKKLNGLEEKYAAYWADNLCKCSCHLCQPDGIKSQYQAVLNEPLLQTSQQ